MPNNIPNNIRVNAEILMRKDVSKIFEHSPRYFRIPGSHCIGNLTAGLSDYFKFSQSGRLCLSVFQKCLKIKTLSKVKYGIYRFDNILKVMHIGPFRHRQSPSL